ncbi:MAG: hypothetical protein ACREPE_11650 [Lysobacter sp.]
MTDATSSAPACSLEAPAFKDRVAWITALNQKYLRESRRQGTQLTLTYDVAASREIEEMVARERECCAFLGFEIRPGSNDVQLIISLPDQAAEQADALLAPFYGNPSTQGDSTCCGTCDAPAAPVKARAVVGTAAVTSTTAVLACGACCVLPLAFPAVAASAAGGLLAWLGGAHMWITGVAVFAVLAAWAWLWRQSVKRKARMASSTLGLMGLASVSLVLALAWPRIEPPLMAALAR